MMFTLLQIPVSQRASVPAASLIADYTAFDRQRAAGRPYLKLLVGLALLVMLGAAVGSVAADQARVVAGVLLLPALVLGIVEAVWSRRLRRRLNGLLADRPEKVIRKS